MHGSTATVMATANSKRRRYQKGQLIRKHGSWQARYYGWASDRDGARIWRERCTAIGRLSDYPNQKDILPDFQEFMAEINAKHFDMAEHDPAFVYFVENVYLKSIQVLALEQSTRKGYQDIWDLHLKALLETETLSTFRPVNCAHVLQRLKDKGLGKRSLQHVKSFLSGIYTFARSEGHFDAANPVTGVRIPKTPAPKDTYAYSNVEEQKMLAVVKTARAKLAIAIASWTGVDKGELEAIRWEDFVAGDLFVKIGRAHV